MSSWEETFNTPDDVIKSEKIGVATTESELRELYFEQNMSVKQVGSELGCSRSTALRFMKEAGIERRSHDDYYEFKKYRDEEWLREEFVEKRKSAAEIADEIGVSASAVNDWVNNFELRDELPIKCNFYLSSGGSMSGYPKWTATGSGCAHQLLVHSLVMIREGADPEKVFGDNKYQIHHRNGFKCDNRASNLELVDRKKHGRHHTPDNKKWTDDDMLAAMRLMMDPSKLLDE